MKSIGREKEAGAMYDDPHLIIVGFTFTRYNINFTEK
jgi:hypothetical protein